MEEEHGANYHSVRTFQPLDGAAAFAIQGISAPAEREEYENRLK